METIQSSWEDFQREAVPEDAPQHQVDYIRATFFGGALTALNLIAQFTELENPQEAKRKVDGLFKEVRAYYNELKKKNLDPDSRQHALSE